MPTETVPPLSEILSRLDALAPGGTLEIAVERRPQALLAALQDARPEAFDWTVLASGVPVRVELRRRDPGAPRGPTEYLTWDHRRLDAIFEEAEDEVVEGAFEEAATRLSVFACGLDHHIEMEEQVLFPAFEAATGMTAGPTAVMRAEHASIRQLLERLAEAVADHRPEAFAVAAQALQDLLGAHNAKEEGILYPMSDRVAGDDAGRREIVRRMQAV